MCNTCEIQWIDENGKPTPDENPSIGMVWCKGYPVKENPAYIPTPSRKYRICAEHLAKMPQDGYWIFEANN